MLINLIKVVSNLENLFQNVTVPHAEERYPSKEQMYEKNAEHIKKEFAQSC